LLSTSTKVETRNLSGESFPLFLAIEKKRREYKRKRKQNLAFPSRNSRVIFLL
jgi:hypothetical protein